jgi:hypothetical protein
MSRKLSRRTILITLIAIFSGLGVARIAPSYTHVRITSGDREVAVEQFRFGPQQTRIQTADVQVESSAW